jgi:hypothetical protein
MQMPPNSWRSDRDPNGPRPLAESVERSLGREIERDPAGRGPRMDRAHRPAPRVRGAVRPGLQICVRSPADLYGLDPDAPRARLSRMGGAWLACLRNHQVIRVDPDAIRLVTRTSARLSVYRPEGGGLLVWEICRPIS